MDWATFWAIFYTKKSGHPALYVATLWSLMQSRSPAAGERTRDLLILIYFSHHSTAKPQSSPIFKKFVPFLSSRSDLSK
jgi:hypothetical protein